MATKEPSTSKGKPSTGESSSKEEPPVQPKVKPRSKSIAEPKLERISEGIKENSEEESSGLINGASAIKASNVRRDSCPRFFGVRSYLHNFYDSIKVKDADQFQDYEEYRYLIAPKRKHKTLLLWRIMFWTGLLLLVIGTIVLSLGYFVPRKENLEPSVDKSGINLVNVFATHFNSTLEWFKVIGLGIFCVGGFLLSTALLLPTLVGSSHFEHDPTADESFRVCLGRPTDDDDENSGIPVTESVKNVQPKREEEAIISGGHPKVLK